LPRFSNHRAWGQQTTGIDHRGRAYVEGLVEDEIGAGRWFAALSPPTLSLNSQRNSWRFGRLFSKFLPPRRFLAAVAMAGRVRI